MSFIRVPRSKAFVFVLFVISSQPEDKHKGKAIGKALMKSGRSNQYGNTGQSSQMPEGKHLWHRTHDRNGAVYADHKFSDSSDQ
jgi:hypothetical protein